ncbi:MAG: tRNA guanosine(34) transglycosylase Tgt [Acidimicrobiia bacterium]|nr:tRNA guanosine(34) transglycosylase Tgt [Acidimicrobiia bacterium]
MSVRWEKRAESDRARLGRLQTPHGPVDTPAFMPVGTRASVKALDSADLETLGAEMMLANTYHLMLRPGAELIDGLGGLHGFARWPHPMLTDSGGYQVFSLAPKVTEDGVAFKSTYDGDRVFLTPEGSVAVQQLLGADIAMQLDVLVGLPAPRAEVEAAMERTLRWGERSLDAHTRADQALFGIVQGGVDPEMRAASAAATADLGFPGFGIGGLSVGEGSEDRNMAIDATVAELPDGKVRYVMGLGDTEGVLDAIARGCDLFDCVWPTRLARHGKVFTAAGDYSIKRAEFAEDDRPLEEGCDCLACSRYSRAYLRHLKRTGELSAQRLLSIHNLRYTMRLMSGIRDAIEHDRFEEFRAERADRRSA